ncbi:MAG: c-type cytochrome [Acidobacteriota bacterium]
MIKRSSAILLVLLAGLPVLGASDDKPSEAILAAYKGKCQPCHMADGNSKVKAMNFCDAEWKSGSGIKQITKVIIDGVPNTAMKGFGDKLTTEEILGLAKYVRSFDKTLNGEK